LLYFLVQPGEHRLELLVIRLFDFLCHLFSFKCPVALRLAGFQLDLRLEFFELLAGNLLCRSGRSEFRILEHVGKVRKVGRNYITRCPSCAEAGHDRSGDNLAIRIDDPRFYKCWAGCTKEMIREAVGCPIRMRQEV
jgi:hypothetical protein